MHAGAQAVVSNGDQAVGAPIDATAGAHGSGQE